ncbi:MAG: HDOD domain-containing protein [Pseudomonadota bacterium]
MTKESIIVMNTARDGGTSTESQQAFAFVQALATELSDGRVQLPSYPEVALRVQRVLSSDDVNPAIVERAIGTEPALALRIMQMANSIALNPNGHEVSNLHTAVGRIGYNMVRNASVAFAMEQLRQASRLKPLKKSLDELWRRGVEVAALAALIARRYTTVNPDVAMLSGLLHGIGKLYILTRLADSPGLQQFPEACERISRDWHANVARALLDNWEISAEVGQAVQEYEDLERDTRGAPTLSDVLATAHLLATWDAEREATPDTVVDLAVVLQSGQRVWQRLKIDKAACEAVLVESAEELAAMRAMLGA